MDLHGSNRIALDGEWDLARQEELNELLGRLNVKGHATIDMRGCTFADSTVLSALALLRVKFADKEVVLVNPSAALRRLLMTANFDKLFRIVDGESTDVFTKADQTTAIDA